MFLNSLTLSAKTVKDTLVTTDGDRIIITYDIIHSDNHYTIRFSNQQKKLGRINGEKYKDLSKVAVMFFDRTGRFCNDVSITNMVPDAFMVPSDVSYDSSSDGFFIVQDEPTLTFVAKGNSEISIPIYLAYHQKKGKYYLFSKCKGMRIGLSSVSAKKHFANTQITQQTITSTTEVEADNSDAIKVVESINRAKDLLNSTEELPFSGNLEYEIAFLRQKQHETTDAELSSQITEVLNLYDTKKSELNEKASAKQLAEQQAQEEKAKREANALQAKNDSISAAQQQQAESDKKRNIWMNIGVVFLAILAFIGNQVFQGYRNSKNQKNMMNLQQSIADKAEEEAKRRARNAIRSTTNRTVNKAKSKVRETVEKKTTIKVNEKTKNLSI